jgi:threonyl-tRNA synthetase
MDIDDHRAIANRLDLFHQQEEGPGVVFWHPRGYAIYRVIEDYIRRHMRRAGFREIRTPQLLARSLWEASGHWEKFGDDMFAFADGERSFALKPMSCPGHLQVFNKGTRSYRDLPLRYCEFGACHRNEASGALHGLMRTRAFVQDDAHIFCTEEQIEEEVRRFCEMLRAVYADFGFPDFIVGFSTRPSLRAGSDETWDRAEAMLAAAARAAGLSPRLQVGEGTFYGPKLEFILRDRQGREWQCGTIQLDFVLPERLGAAYVDADNKRRQPAMMHQAILGSIERFLAMLLEHHGGDLPLWLAPDQLVVANIGEAQAGYAERVADAFAQADFRVALDIRPERLPRKIVHARESGIPLLVAVGDREAKDETVSLRYRDSRQSVLPLAQAIDTLRPEAFRLP